MSLTTNYIVGETTLTENKGFLQPTGFSVVINRGLYANLEYFAQSVQHPGATVSALELPIRQITSVPLAGDKITYSEMSLQLIVDEDMASYKEMQAWLERTIQGQTYGADGREIPIYSDITLLILTSQNNPNISIKYQDCIPTAISSIEFNSTTGDLQYITFDATFRFAKFEIV